jgi:protein SCO1/2
MKHAAVGGGRATGMAHVDRRDRTLAPTLLACIATLATIGATASWMTRGFSTWTYEDVRVQRAAEGSLRAPPVLLRHPRGGRLQPWPPAGDAPDGPRVYVVDFVFTRCPTICLALGTAFQQMQRRLQQEAAGVQLLSISFDIARDSDADLAAYARRHGADPSVWQVAAPVDAVQKDELLRSLGVVAVPDGTGGFVHNAALHVVDHDGRLRGLHALADWEQALAQARRLATAGESP